VSRCQVSSFTRNQRLTNGGVHSELPLRIIMHCVYDGDREAHIYSVLINSKSFADYNDIIEVSRFTHTKYLLSYSLTL
jgi:hypothetical protein